MKHLLLLIGMALISCHTSRESVSYPPLVRYDPSPELADVLKRAKDAKKLVLIDFYTEWCLPCKLMDKDVYSDKATAEFMNDHFINYKVDAEKNEGPDLSLIYSVDAYPTILFLDPRGKVVKRHVGILSLQKFNALMEDVLALPKTWM